MNKPSLVLFLLFATFSLEAQTWQDAIVGGWINGDHDGKVEIYKQGNKNYGKI